MGFVRTALPYRWTVNEIRALYPFFSNLDRRVFFMHGLPPNVGATVFAMFSRLKNLRGIRGVFVDQYVPQLCAAELCEVADEFGGDEEAFLKQRKIKTLDEFMRYSPEASDAANVFLDGMRQDPRALLMLVKSAKAKRFIEKYLGFGHNSIGRMATMWLGFEGISLLAIKSLAWSRPGAAQIALSTRYVDFSGKDVYPIWEDLAEFGVDEGRVRAVIARSFALYRELLDVFPAFLRQYWGTHTAFADHPKDLEAGISGETFDVLGNLLPAATLSSAGFSVSGEALPGVVKHLLLDATPENAELAELIREESEKVGAIQFLRHDEPDEWERRNWRYLALEIFKDLCHASDGEPIAVPIPDQVDGDAQRMIRWLFWLEGNFAPVNDLDSALDDLLGFPRAEFDKLPRIFEALTVPFIGVMSFRGWRDLQRQSLSTHLRTHLTAKLGFYRYDKPAPPELGRAFEELAAANRELERELEAKGVPATIRQYPLALGNRVGFLMSSNLRQWEFCNWQRTKWNVNHEVRQVFLAIERALRRRYHWWERVSRADVARGYCFARGSRPVPLPPKKFV